MSLALLHTNDFHGTLTLEKARDIAALKAELGALYFDSGDCIKTGNLGVPLRPEKAWELLHLAGCDAGTLGNRETHVLASAFKAKLEGHRHPLLCANLRCKDGTRPLPEHVILGNVGVFGVMVPMVTERMATQAASAYLWDPPITTAKRKVEELRGQVDCLIALTHIGFKKDQELAAVCPEIDVILGGHSHTDLQHPLRMGDTFICQGGSHGKFIGRYEWAGRGQLDGSLHAL